MKENLNWGLIFTTKNFGDMEDGVLAAGVLAAGVLAHGVLEECFHEDQSKIPAEDIPELRKEGYVHWKDQSIGSSIDLHIWQLWRRVGVHSLPLKCEDRLIYQP